MDMPIFKNMRKDSTHYTGERLIRRITFLGSYIPLNAVGASLQPISARQRAQLYRKNTQTAYYLFVTFNRLNNRHYRLAQPAIFAACGHRIISMQRDHTSVEDTRKISG